MAKHFLGNPGVRVAVLAQRPHVVLTGPALAARNRKRHNHTIPDFDLFYFLTDFDHFAHELVAENVTALHRWHESVEQMKIGSTDCRRRDTYDGVTVVENLWVRHVFDFDVFRALPAVCSHLSSLQFAVFGRPSGVHARHGGGVGLNDLTDLHYLLEAAK